MKNINGNIYDPIENTFCNINSESVINDYTDTDANINENINAPIDNVFYCIISNNNAPKPPHVKTEILPVSLRSTHMKASIMHPHSPYTIKHTYDLQSDFLLYNSETCQSVCRYMCLCQFSSGQKYELQSVSLLYNNETCQSVCLKVCTCHSLNRPSMTQLKISNRKQQE